MPKKPKKVNTILQDMIQRIKAGEWKANEAVPTRNELVTAYDVTSTTINSVFNLLHAMGYIMLRGRNIVINPNRMTIPALVPSFDKYLIQHGLIPFMENIGDPQVVTLDKDAAESFDLPEGTKAIKRGRVQGETQAGQNIPYRLTETYYLYDLASQYLPQMTSNPLFVAIDSIRQDTGKAIAKSSIKMLTRFPSEQEQHLLNIPLHTPVTEMYRVSRADDGTVIMFSRIVLISYRFTVSIDAADTRL
jgi:DNA-binding GntR family transcriptional regulator